MILISLRNGLRSTLTLSKLKKISGGACPQTPVVGAASAALLSLHPLFKIPGYATGGGGGGWEVYRSEFLYSPRLISGILLFSCTIKFLNAVTPSFAAL